MHQVTYLSIAKEVIQTEIDGLQFMETRLDRTFDDAIELILNGDGRTIFCGMGKSGIIGRKIAASFASTGTPAFFMHPAEAFHGDLGMVKPEDIFIAISNSGETDEVLKLLPFLLENGNKLISITGNENSTLSQKSACHLDVSVPKEACHMQLAPTSSTTAALVMGDALTVALMKARDFKPENFAKFHPGGALGRRLLGNVKDSMYEDNLPIVDINSSISAVISQISSGRLGHAIVFERGKACGIITDGDLRRAIEKYGKNSFDLTAGHICTANPVTISKNASVQSAYKLMESESVNFLVVVDCEEIVGIFKK